MILVFHVKDLVVLLLLFFVLRAYLQVINLAFTCLLGKWTNVPPLMFPMVLP